MRWIIPVSGAGEGRPPGLVSVNWYCMSSENTTDDCAVFWNSASVSRCTVWVGTLTETSVPVLGLNCGTVTSVFTSVRWRARVPVSQVVWSAPAGPGVAATRRPLPRSRVVNAAATRRAKGLGRTLDLLVGAGAPRAPARLLGHACGGGVTSVSSGGAVLEVQLRGDLVRLVTEGVERVHLRGAAGE